eukprot:SAG25_NODE_298_length_10188_cov_5.941421_11_plen_82_part_00
MAGNFEIVYFATATTCSTNCQDPRKSAYGLGRACTDSYSGIEEMLRLGCEQTRTIHGAQMVRRPRTLLALAYHSDRAQKLR